MEVTTETLKKYEGGQMEGRSRWQNNVHRGEIETIRVVDEELHVTFKWLAKGKGVHPSQWVKVDLTEVVLGLEICLIEPNDESGSGNTIRISTPPGHDFDQAFILHPPDGDKLDPATVEGLKLA